MAKFHGLGEKYDFRNGFYLEFLFQGTFPGGGGFSAQSGSKSRAATCGGNGMPPSTRN
jgi:hypothetical protein